MDIQHDMTGQRLSEGYRVTTSCWFVDEFLERRPEYQDLVAG